MKEKKKSGHIKKTMEQARKVTYKNKQAKYIYLTRYKRITYLQHHIVHC